MFSKLESNSTESLFKLGIFAFAMYCVYQIFEFNTAGATSVAWKDMGYWEWRNMTLYYGMSAVLVHSAVFGVSRNTRRWAIFIIFFMAFQTVLFTFLQTIMTNWVQGSLHNTFASLTCYMLYKYHKVVTFYVSKLFFLAAKYSPIKGVFVMAEKMVLKTVDRNKTLKENETKILVADLFGALSRYSVSRKIGQFFLDTGETTHLSSMMIWVAKLTLAFDIMFAFFLFIYAAVYSPLDGSIYARMVDLGHPDFFMMSWIISDFIGIYFCWLLVVNSIREKSGEVSIGVSPETKEVWDREYEKMIQEDSKSS